MPNSFPDRSAGSLDNDIEIIAMEGVNDNDHGSAEDSDDDSEDSGDVALLGSQSSRQTRPHFSSATGSWPQVKNIVLEVEDLYSHYRHYLILQKSAPTLLVTTISLLLTGKFLDQVSRWPAMREVDQLIIIVPVVLNLKGNLEMNLSARFGTAANVGELDEPKQRRAMIIGNLTLLQVQAAVVAFVAACIAILLGLFVTREAPAASASNNSNATAALLMRNLLVPNGLTSRKAIPPPHPESKRNTDLATLMMVASTTMSATCISGLILGSFMCNLIVLCRKFNRDPDNIAPAMASCLGDFVTLCFIGLVSTFLISFLNTPLPFIVAIIIILISLTSLIYTLRNKYVRYLLSEGWTPLFGAMIVSTGAGIVLDVFVRKYEGFALLSVVISGLPGAVGSIFVSRLSTALHAAALSGPSRSLPEKQPSGRLVMLTLFFITIPVEIISLIALRAIGWLTVPVIFIVISVLFFCVAVIISLTIARLLTNWLWSKHRDPDMYALPIHSSVVDLIGQLLLVLCFETVSLLGGRVQHRA